MSAVEVPWPAFEAVIFDMDGLVLDSEPTYVFAWKKAAAEFAVHLDDAFTESLFGRQAADVERAVADKIGPGFERERFHALASDYWQAHVADCGIAPMPGVHDLLAALDGLAIPYALATNSNAAYAAQCLRLAGLEGRFPLAVTRDQVAEGKPAPDLFLEAASRLGVAARHCLVLEDSATGLLAARRAGAVPALVLARPAPDESKALAALAFRSLQEVALGLAARASSPASPLFTRPEDFGEKP
jgi:HAD superfamily hydrolase (TIGR01509 family)